MSATTSNNNLQANPIRVATARRLVSLLPERGYTEVVGRLAQKRVPVWLRRPLYAAYARAVGAQLSEAAQQPESFRTLNEMFTRELAPGARPWGVPAGGVGVPADGRIAAIGMTASGRLIQAKELKYDVDSLVGERAPTQMRFATVYLSPADYHRVHAPFEFRVDRVHHLGGCLYPVNSLSVPFVQDLFAVNERVVLVGRRADGNWCAVVLVAALGVGWMSLAKGPQLRSDHDSAVSTTYECGEDLRFAAGEELGRFSLGSTVIVLDSGTKSDFPLCPGDACRVGQVLFG